LQLLLCTGRCTLQPVSSLDQQIMPQLLSCAVHGVRNTAPCTKISRQKTMLMGFSFKTWDASNDASQQKKLCNSKQP